MAKKRQARADRRAKRRESRPKLGQGKIAELLKGAAEKWGGDGVDRPILKAGLEYLVKFGYLDPKAATIISVVKALRRLQKDAGLSRSGTLDVQTMTAMETPRSGCREQFGRGTAKWGKRHLTYYVERYVEGIPKGEQRDIFDEGYNAWSRVCNMRFSRVNSAGSADILMSTSSSRILGFGRRGGTLASAGLPGSSNWDYQLPLDFDTAEIWRASAGQVGTLLLNVHTHEAGHIIGLRHDNSGATALMNPFYSESVTAPLQPDARRASGLYGEPTEPPASTDPTYSVGPDGSIRLHGHTLQKV